MLDEESQSAARCRVGLFMPTLSDGGAERVMLNLAGGLLEHTDVEVELIVVRAVGPRRAEVPPNLALVEFGRSRTTLALWDLVRHVRERRHDVIVSALPPANAVATIACRLAGVGTRSIVTQHTDMSISSRPWSVGHLVAKYAYPRAHVVVAVSEGVRTDLVRHHGVAADSVVTVYNPVITPKMEELSREQPSHPWVSDNGPPLVMAAGRLNADKDFSSLLRAIRLVNDQTAVRLIIAGEGEARSQLERLRNTLDLDEVVDLIGFVPNPYPLMRAADLFVLSSRREGLPTVLIESLYCGTPVVSTECPSGPQEILDSGRYGQLVPVGNPPALAAAILAQLEAPTPVSSASWLRFSSSVAVDRYLELMEP